MMEQILSRPNLLKAIKRVEKNKGSHGIDQMPTTDLRVYVMENWHTMREQLLSGTYQPQPCDGSKSRNLTAELEN